MSTKFSDEDLAVQFLEGIFWPDGPSCCEGAGAWALTGESYRAGLKKCKRCRRMFSVREATPFTGFKIPLQKCLRAVVSHFREGRVTTQRIADDLGVNWETAKALRETLDKESNRSQVYRLVHALQPSVAVPLVMAPTATSADREPNESAPNNEKRSIFDAAVPVPEGTTQNGAAIARAS